MQNEFTSRKWQWLGRLIVVIPSLAIVSALILYCGFFVSMIFFLVEGKPIVWIVLAAAIELVIAVWFGASFFRFGVRLLPLRGDGGRDKLAISILIGALVTIAGLFIFAIWKTGPVMVDGISDPATSADGEAANLIAIGRMAETVFVFLGGLSLWVASAMASPLVVLLFNHLNPLRWRNKPHLLFLRRFSGMSNVIGIGPIFGGTPSNIHVVLLVGPGTSGRLWNPLMMAFAGARFLNPFSAAPVCLRCGDDTWQSVVRSLATDAKAIVIDLTHDSNSMDFEKDLIRELNRPGTVLAVRDAAVPSSDSKLDIEEIDYRTGWIGTVPLLIVTFIGCFVACQLTAAGILSLPFLEPVLSGIDETIPLAILWILSLLFSLWAAWWYSWHPVLKRKSAKEIRNRVKSVFD